MKYISINVLSFYVLTAALQLNGGACFYSGLDNQQANSRYHLSIKPVDHDFPYSHFSQRQAHFLYNTQQHIKKMSVAQLQHYIVTHKWSEKQILENPTWYLNDNYCAIAKKLPEYATYVNFYYKKYLKYGTVKKLLGRLAGTYKHKLAKRFVQLKHECESEAAQKKQSSFALRATADKQEQLIQEQEEYRHDLGRLENELISRDVKKAYQQARLNALGETQYNNNRNAYIFVPAHDVCTFAQGYEISVNDLNHIVGNAYEFQLHTEFLEQLKQATALKPLYTHTQEHDVFLDMVGHSVAFGIQANRDNDALTATYWSDIAWKSLDLASAFGEGLALGVYNTAAVVGNAIKHPVETLKTVVHGVGSVVGMLAQVTGAVLRLHALEHREHREQLEAELDEFVDQMDCVINHCSDQLFKMPLREKVKHVTAFGTELIIPGKAFKVVHNVCSRMRPVAIGLFHALRDEQKAVQVAARVEGIAGNVGMKVVEGVQEVAATAKAMLNEAQLLLQSFHGELMRKLQPEIAGLRALFDNKIKGFGEFAHKYLKIDYEHILGMDLSFNAKGALDFAGFHHDWMGTIEKSNIIKFTDKMMGPVGCYRADIIVGEKMFRHKTFFSAEWPREKVISKIYEAYQEFILSGKSPVLQKNGTYKITGVIKEGIEINIYITKKGRITTAYPLV